MKKKYIWSIKHQYWHEPERVTGYKYHNGKWIKCWVEPEAESVLCWYPQMAGKLISFGSSY